MIKNKFHFAINGQTAAEIISSTANFDKEIKKLTEGGSPNLGNSR